MIYASVPDQVGVRRGSERIKHIADRTRRTWMKRGLNEELISKLWLERVSLRENAPNAIQKLEKIFQELPQEILTSLNKPHQTLNHVMCSNSSAGG